MIEQASLVIGNGNWAVKSDSLLGYKTIDGKYYPREMSVVRATTGTRINEDGLVELVPYNLVNYSEQFDNAAWDKFNGSITANTAISPSGVQDADNFIPSATSGAHALRSNFVNTTTTTSHSFFVKANGYTKVSVRESQIGGNYASFDLSNGTLLDTNQSGYIENYGNGWYRCTLIDTLFGTGARSGLFVLPPSYTSGSPTITWLPNGTSGVFVWGAQLVEGSSALDYLPTTDRLDVARIDYSSGSGALLVEPQRTNLALQSSSFDSATWTKAGASVTANSTTSPSGITDADTLIESATNATHLVLQSVSVTAANHTFSCYVKAVSGSTRNVGILFNLTGKGVLLNPSTGAVVSYINTTAADVTISNVGNGWFRVSVTALTAAITESIRIYLGNGTTWTAPYLGDGTSGVYIWGAQLEAGSYPTSYIPTTSASVTRNQDVCLKTGATALIGQTEGTLYAEFNITNLVGDRTIFEIGADNSNRIRLRINGNYISANVFLAGSLVANITFVFQPLGNYKFAYAYKQNDFQAYLNGNAGTAVTSGNIPSSMSIIGVGTRIVTADIFNDSISTAALWKERLTNDELATLTTL